MILHKEWSLCEAFGLVSSRVKGTGWIIILYVPLGLEDLVRLEERGSQSSVMYGRIKSLIASK
jgi:hypothetical protein